MLRSIPDNVKEEGCRQGPTRTRGVDKCRGKVYSKFRRETNIR